ncbi:MAG: hypothetical protein ACREDE_03725 [Thermoplasmata archaeon]
MEPPAAGAAVRPVWYAGSDSWWGEFWTMLHLPYTVMVLSFVTVGASLAPRVSWVILAGTLLAYFLGLGIGAHFLDQIPGMGSRYARHWPKSTLWLAGFGALGIAVAIGVIGAVWFVGPPLLFLVGVQALCAIGYPLAKWFGGAFHRDSVFAVSWGSLPFLTSYFAQAGTIDLLSVGVALIFGGVAVLEIRLSRSSRTLRAGARSPPVAHSAYRRFDRALQALATTTIAAAMALIASRVVLAIW